MNNQPDLSKILERHAGGSTRCRVSGVSDIWICDHEGKWARYALDAEAKQKLQEVCVQYGEQVYHSQWDFSREDFIQHVLPIVDKEAWRKARIVELGFGQYV